MPYNEFDFAGAVSVSATLLTNPTGIPDKRTLLEFRTRLQAEIAGRNDVTPEELDDYIFSGYKEVVGMVKPAETFVSFAFNLTAGEELYVFPQSLRNITFVSIRDTTEDYEPGEPLDLIDLATWRKLEHMEGIPEACHRTFSGSRVYAAFWTKPAAAYTVAIDGTAFPTKMVDDDEQTILGQDFDDIVQLYAKKWALEGLREYGEAGIIQNIATAQLRQLSDRTTEGREDHRASLRPVRNERELRNLRRGRGLFRES